MLEARLFCPAGPKKGAARLLTFSHLPIDPLVISHFGLLEKTARTSFVALKGDLETAQHLWLCKGYKNDLIC